MISIEILKLGLVKILKLGLVKILIFRFIGDADVLLKR